MNTNYAVPMVLTREGNTERAMDLASRMLQDRIVFLNGEVNDASSYLIVSQLLFLNSESPNEPILLYINSPGGSVTAGLAIKATMDYINAPVHTIGMGMQASMGAFLLASGEKGERAVLPDSTIMIHQVLGGYNGQTSDAKRHYEYQQSLNDKLIKYLSEYTDGKYSFEEMEKECDRDNFLTPEEAIEMGLIDKIITKETNTTEEA
jgi:ATP-dependent Clp protease protease subunit